MKRLIYLALGSLIALFTLSACSAVEKTDNSLMLNVGKLFGDEKGDGK